MTGSGMAAVDTKAKAGDNFRTPRLAGAAEDLENANDAKFIRGRILLNADYFEEGE